MEVTLEKIFICMPLEENGPHLEGGTHNGEFS